MSLCKGRPLLPLHLATLSCKSIPARRICSLVKGISPASRSSSPCLCAKLSGIKSCDSLLCPGSICGASCLEPSCWLSWRSHRLGSLLVDQFVDYHLLGRPVDPLLCWGFHPTPVQSITYVPLSPQNPVAFAPPTMAAQLAAPVPRQIAPLCLNLPVGLDPSLFPQGLLCPSPLDPLVGHLLEVLSLHLRRRHLWRGLPQEPSGTITRSSTNPTNTLKKPQRKSKV